MLYLVKIGHYSRRGNFQEFCVRPVESDATEGELRTHFEKQYKGFSVQLFHFENVSPETLNPQSVEKSYLTDVPVKYTKEEQAIADEYRKHQAKANDLMKELHIVVTKRYEGMSYVKPSYLWRNDGNLELKTDIHRTCIKKLPIHGKALIHHLGEGNEV